MVVVKPDTPDELEDWRRLEAEVRAEEAPYESLRAYAPFHSDRAARARLLEKRLAQTDVLNLHWTRGLVDWPAFMAARQPGQALVWTLHDQQAFTGGCHYAGDCTGFTTACGHCPVLNSTRADDLSAQVLARKGRALATLRAPLHIVTPSRWMANEAQRSWLFTDRPIHVVPYGLDAGLFRPVDDSALRQRLGIAPTDRVVLFIAHMLNDPRKGYALLQAGLSALAEPAGIVLMTVGQGEIPNPAGIRTIAMGPLTADTDLAPLYALADLVAVPSGQDNYPNTALEDRKSVV
jgi:glycosyltransferase involved in cell wall biosynthesis